MNKLEYIVKERTMSGFGLSVGTGLALESVFTPTDPVIDPTRPIPAKVNLGNYDYYYFEVDTLIRNIIASVGPKNDLMNNFKVAVKVIAQAFEKEVYTLKMLFSTPEAKDCELRFYVSKACPIKDLYMWPDLTRIRKGQAATMEDLIESVRTYLKDYLKEYTNATLGIPFTKDNIVLTTRHPLDLVQWKKYGDLHLLESHTGVLKKPSTFNTKYVKIPKSDSTSMLPFYLPLLILFGDKVDFKPVSIKYRRLILDMAMDKRWNPLTSETTIRRDLKSNHDLVDILEETGALNIDLAQLTIKYF